MKTLIITDGKPGHVNQARALCSVMQWNSEEFVIEYPCRVSKGSTYLLDWLGISVKKVFIVKSAETGDILNVSEIPVKYGIVVSVGSASYYPAKVLGKAMKLPVVALMYPRGFRKNFRHILCPVYDNPPQRNNITTLPITLSSRDPIFYREMTEDFGKRVSYMLPSAGVIIGGDNKYERVSPERIRQQLQQLFDLTPNHQHWVTTSRRTGKEVENVVESFPFDYKLIYSKEQYNPIPAFLNLSEYLFVTSDSSSMISDCVSTGKAKVEVLKNISKKKSKFDRFLTGLSEMGCIHLFDGQLGSADKKIVLEKDIQNALAPIIAELDKNRGSL